MMLSLAFAALLGHHGVEGNGVANDTLMGQKVVFEDSGIAIEMPKSIVGTSDTVQQEDTNCTQPGYWGGCSKLPGDPERAKCKRGCTANGGTWKWQRTPPLHRFDYCCCFADGDDKHKRCGSLVE